MLTEFEVADKFLKLLDSFSGISSLERVSEENDILGSTVVDLRVWVLELWLDPSIRLPPFLPEITVSLLVKTHELLVFEGLVLLVAGLVAGGSGDDDLLPDHQLVLVNH